MDVRIVWNNTYGLGDFAMAGTGLATGNELETAILISLFSDAQADPGDIVFDTDPRGWWADTYAALEDPALPVIANYRTGSKLWQVFNMPRNQNTLNWMQQEILDSLNWMLIDGVAQAINAVGYFTGSGGVGATVVVTSNGVNTTYTYAWAQETGTGVVPPVTSAWDLSPVPLPPAPPPLPIPQTDENGNLLFMNGQPVFVYN